MYSLFDTLSFPVHVITIHCPICWCIELIGYTYHHYTRQLLTHPTLLGANNIPIVSSWLAVLQNQFANIINVAIAPMYTAEIKFNSQLKFAISILNLIAHKWSLHHWIESLQNSYYNNTILHVLLYYFHYWIVVFHII